MIKNNNPKNDLLVEDLRLLERYIEEFWEFLPLPACVISPTFTILSIGRSFEEFSGYKESEVVGENLKNFLKGNQETWESLLQKGEISNLEMIFLSKAKRETPVNISAKARKDEKGDLIGYFFAIIDLSEIKEKEKELKEKVKELERFNKLAVGRELKMRELKEEIERLKKEIKDKK